MVFQRSVWPVFVMANLAVVGLSACAPGESEAPGCQSDADCSDEWVCRAGACFRIIGDVDASVQDDAG